MDKDKFQQFLNSFNTIEDVYTYSREINFSQIVKPISIRASAAHKKIFDEISYIHPPTASRVKTPESQFFKHLSHNFQYEKQYDLIAFLLLTDSIENSEELFCKLRQKYPIPGSMSKIWNPATWNYSIGARNTLSDAIFDNYRSLDFYLYHESEGAIFEVQCRPYSFQSQNISNYAGYKKFVLNHTKSKVRDGNQNFASNNFEKISFWENTKFNSNKCLLNLLIDYGGSFT